MSSLDDVRSRIDSIDEQICDLFARRMACSQELAERKLELGLPVTDRRRERAKLRLVAERVPAGLRDATTLLLDHIMEESRLAQSVAIGAPSGLGDDIRAAIRDTPALFGRDARVVCQGVEGAYSQIAADRLFKRPRLSFRDSFEGVFEAVEGGEADYGVVPVENSTAGSVNQVYDLMANHRFSIVRTLRLKVEHTLVARPGTTLAGVRDISGHQQAIDQCARFLAGLSGVRVHAAANTAMAAKLVAESEQPGAAALSSRAAARLYGLDVLASNVQDQANNYTRFACISRRLQIFGWADRTSLMVVTPNEPGSLYKVLARFYALDINLIKLESRPIPDSDFRFMFYFDLQCPVAAPEFAMLMGTLSETCEEFRYLGSYSEVV